MFVRAALKAMNVTAEQWEAEVLGSPDLVLVDFWAPWCGPCRMIGPTIDELIDEMGDKFKAVGSFVCEGYKVRGGGF